MIPGTPIPMTADEEKKLIDTIDGELSEALDIHAEREDRLAEWDRAYDGDPKEKKKNFPWPGAANIEVPIIGISVDAIVARVINTIFAVTPFWSVRPLSRLIDPYAKPLEDFMDWSQKNEMQLYRQLRPWAIQLVKHGWAWLKKGWVVEMRPSFVTLPSGQTIRKDEVVKRPMVYWVHNRDVIVQAGFEDETQAEWTAHRFRLSDNQLLLRKFENVYQNVDTAIKIKDDAWKHHEDMANFAGEQMPSKEKVNTFYEMHMQYAWRDNPPVPMLVVYHKPTRSIMRKVFAPYPFKCLQKTKFIDREGRLEGFGIAKRLWHLQEEISTLHRQQVDNATIANTRFFVGKKNAVRNGTQIWPGRLLTVKDPNNDFKAFQLGDIYQSQGVLEMRAIGYSEKASGISDYQVGRESSVAGSRATATGTLAVIQEGNRRFDLNIRDARDILSEVGRDVLLMNQMFRPRGAAYFVQGQDGKWTEEMLDLPPDFTVSKLAVELGASTATINKEVEKQGLMALMGVTQQYYAQLKDIAMIMMSQEVPAEGKELAMRVAKALEYQMKNIARSFDVKAIDTIVPGVMPDDQNGIGPAAGGPAGGPNPDQEQSPLDALSRLHGEFIRNGNDRDGGRQEL
jgi:hypothetical protein